MAQISYTNNIVFLKKRANMKWKTESQVLNNLLVDFVKSPHIKDVFKLFEEWNLAGIEKWFQIELFHFLYKHEKVSNTDLFKEEQFKTKHKKYQIDLTFKIKNWSYYIGLELKHHRFFALTEIENDLDRLSGIRDDDKEYFRVLFALLIHQSNTKSAKDFQQKIERDTSKSNFEFCIEIPETNYFCTAISRSINDL
jgi:hypothetical protein